MQDAESKKRTLKILLIDDDEFQRDRLERDFVALGYSVCTASTSEDTFDCLSRFEPNWSVVEPALTGVPWVRFLRAVSEALKDRPWLVLTAFTSTAMRAESVRLGARQALSKPASATRVVQALEGPRGIHELHESEDLSLARVEWEHLNNVLRLCEGNVTEAARLLGIPRQSLYNKLRKLPTLRATVDTSSSKYLTRRS